MSKYNLASQGDLELEKALLGLDNQGLPLTVGNKYYVMLAADAGYAHFYDKYQQRYPDGTMAVHNTITSAMSAATSNRHDIIFINANGGHTQTAMITVSKSRLHFVGMGFRGGSIGMGARARITMGATGVATDVAVMLNTGVGNTFSGLKFDSSSTTAESLYSVVESGEYAIYEGCEFYKSEDLDDAGAAEILLNGDSAQFIDCYIGSTVNETGNIRANVLCTASTAPSGTKQLRDCHFIDCFFAAKADDTDKVFVYGANGTDVQRSLTFKGCTFFNNPLSAGTPAAAIAFGAAQTRGAVFCDANTACVDVSVLGTTGQNIFVLQQDGATYATAGLAAQA